MNDEILKRLDILAAKIGTTTEHLWAVLIRQARIEAITDALFLVLSILGCYLLIRTSLLVWKKAYFVCSILSGIGAVVLFCVGIACLFELPTEVFNPEYFALTKVLSTLK